MKCQCQGRLGATGRDQLRVIEQEVASRAARSAILRDDWLCPEINLICHFYSSDILIPGEGGRSLPQ